MTARSGPDVVKAPGPVPADNPGDGLEELDFRSSGGIEAALIWDRARDALLVTVLDKKLGQFFEVHVQAGQRALDVFHHPFAYHHSSRGSASERPRRRVASDRPPTRPRGLL
jgi:hypothetical protein